MDEILAEEEIEEMQKDIILSSRRLSLLMEYIDFKNINLIEKIIICDFLNEIAYNIKTPTENVTYQIGQN